MDSTSVLEIFKKITTIPRESGHEEPMTEFLVEFAKSHSLAYKKDYIGNVLIIREAAPGKENVPPIVLQAHQDMVCEKNGGVEHDFSKDPINFTIEDGWMIAKDTTLGADDGIGIAACLALLEDSTPSGKIECLFTISEETGMDGAEALQPGFFEGRTLINLDSEDEGQIFIGCAGGLNTQITMRYEKAELKKGFSPIRLSITGATGGHSGDDINKERMNTIAQMARFIYSELPNGLQLISFDGGNKPNAIARECEAVVAASDAKQFCERFLTFGNTLKLEEFSVTEPDVKFSAESVSTEQKPLDDKSAADLICALFSMPHGVQAMSQTVPGLVETSSNLASVKMKGEGEIMIVTSQRSAIKAARRMMSDRVEASFRGMNVKVEKLYEYPGWTPNPESPILKACVDTYKRLFGQEPLVLAIHAGLECGLFGEKFGNLDMISLGPTLRGVHAPGERLELASMDKFVLLLKELVCNYA